MATLNSFEDWTRISHNDFFDTEQKVVVHRYRNSCSITLAEDSLIRGKKCYKFNICEPHNSDKCPFLNWLSEKFNFRMENLVTWLRILDVNSPRGLVAEIEEYGISIYVNTQRAVDVVTPWGLERKKAAASKYAKKSEFVVNGIQTEIVIDNYIRFKNAGDNGEDVVIKLGDEVQVDSYNLHYYGNIVGIKNTYIETLGCPKGLIHNTYENILSRNRSQKRLERDATADANWTD